MKKEPSEAPFVDFLVIGAQKAGTTAFRYYLSQHPRIFVPLNEVHYFDDECFKGTQSDQRAYHRHFAGSRPEQLRGEVTPIYMYWRPAIPRIARYRPSIRLVAILRNPALRAYSGWNMEVSRGRESRSFEQAIEDELERLQSRDHTQDRTCSYLDRGFYAKQIEIIWQYFPKHQLHVLKAEDLQEHREAAMQGLAEFLNVDPAPFLEVPPPRKHVGQYRDQMNPQVRIRLSRIFEADVNRLQDMLGWDLTPWLDPETWDG